MIAFNSLEQAINFPSIESWKIALLALAGSV
jgi:hypothetical protein